MSLKKPFTYSCGCGEVHTVDPLHVDMLDELVRIGKIDVEWAAARAEIDDRRNRGMICGRCGRHTDNNTQGHYWRVCKVKGGLADVYHFCCPPPYGCSLSKREGSPS